MQIESFRAITTVYSYYPPEIRKIIDRVVVEYPHDVFLRSITPGLDHFHEPIIEKIMHFFRREAPGLKKFTFAYPTAGSEEGIREFMSVLQLQGIDTVYMYRGDYEGYREVAKTRGIVIQEVDFNANPADLKPGHWFLSNPSARNGMVLPNEVVNDICNAGHKVFYDLSYMGSTLPRVFDLRHPNIVAAAVSFSKPFGLFYYRIGFTFSNYEIPALYANKWFKNVLGLIIAEQVVDNLALYAYVTRYRHLQQSIIQEIREGSGLDLTPSDTFLLAHSRQELPAELQKFKRGDYYRFCLTPYFLESENR